MLRAPTQSGVVRHIERWVVWSFTVASGVLGAIAIGNAVLGFGDGVTDRAQLVAVGLVTATLTFVALRLALRARTPGRVAIATFGWAIVFAALNSPACFVAASLFHPSSISNDIASAMLAALVFGLIFSLPLGCAWALALVGPMFVAAELRQEPTLDGPDRALRAVAGTLAVVSLFGLLFARQVPALQILLAAVIAAGSITTVVATYRIHRFDTFLKRVRRGELPGWEIVSLRDLDEDQTVPDDLPCTDLDHHPDAVLVRIVEGGGDGAYRTGGPSRIAWARTRG